MKRAIALLAILTANSLLAEDPRAVRANLINDLLAVIDSKSLTQSMFDVFLTGAEQVNAEQANEMRTYRERLYARIDYTKYAEEVYAPIFERLFSNDELRELIAFYKTQAGQKNLKVLSELAAGTLTKSTQTMQELSEAINDEIQRERLAGRPWMATMVDLRSVATATEAYATDTNLYPRVSDYSQLKGVLSPTYIRELPEKDAWGTPYVYTVSPDGAHYRFASAGADRRFEWNARQVDSLPEEYEGRPSDTLDTDIIFQDGVFIQFPAMATGLGGKRQGDEN